MIEAVSGCSGGRAETATYKQTSAGDTNHREVVEVQYDASQVSYKELVDFHLRHIAPRDNGCQFYDRGYVYSSGIFYDNETQKAEAEASLAELNQLGGSNEISIPVEPRKAFYQAEEYHQDYYLKKTSALPVLPQRFGPRFILEAGLGVTAFKINFKLKIVPKCDIIK